MLQHLPLQSLFWTKTWRAFRASDPNRGEVGKEGGGDRVGGEGREAREGRA